MHYLNRRMTGILKVNAHGIIGVDIIAVSAISGNALVRAHNSKDAIHKDDVLLVKWDNVCEVA